MRSERINFLAVVTAVAGLTGFVGVYAKWFNYTYRVEGGFIDIFLDGTWDATGTIALVAGIGALLFGCAYMLLTDAAIRRIVALLMVLSSVVLLLSSAIGFTRAGEAVTNSPILLGAEGPTRFTASVAIGVGISLVSGILATVASVLLVSRREQGLENDEATPAPVSASV